MKSDPNTTKPDTTKKRRRLTDEELIAERKAEIAAIKAGQRKRALEFASTARVSLQAAAMLADQCGMADESKKWGAALAALGEDEAGL